MRWRPFRSSTFLMALAAATIPTLCGGNARGQDAGYENPLRVAQTPQSPYLPSPSVGAEAGGAPAPEASVSPGAGAPAPSGFGEGSAAMTEALGPGAGGATGNFPSFTPGQSAALGGSTLSIADNAGYIDSAIIRTRFRQRYDSAYDLNRPDRAEFFYPKCGCFGNISNFAQFLSIGNAGGMPVLNGLGAARRAGYDPRALGPQHPHNRPRAASGGESRIDYQEVASYLEIAATPTTSGFIEVPARFLNPTLNRNTYGFSDINLGFKHAFVAEPDRFYTFQFRTYVPTGSGERGLGTNHASLEPALLVFQRLSDRLYFSGEFRDWIPIHATDFGGNVLRYGAGLAYNMVLTDRVRIAPVNEFVGWTVLSGKQLNPGSADPNIIVPNSGQVSAAGETIVNYKIGLRVGFGQYNNPGGGSGLNDRHSFYFGYGHALTGDHWYRDILRVEYNLWF
jgi:hypothetical protein